MAERTMALDELLRNLGVDREFLRHSVEVVTRLVMEMESQEKVGAGRHERAEGR